MATIEWAQERGRELIKSEVVVLDKSSSAEFVELGLSGATIGASVFLNVGIERHGIPVIASLVIDGSESEVDLVLAATLMHGSTPFSNRDTSRLNWASFVSATEKVKEEDASSSPSKSDEAGPSGLVPSVKPRAVARARPTVPSPEQAEGSKAKSLQALGLKA